MFFDKADVPAIRARAATPAIKPVLESIRKMAEIDPFGPDNRKTLGNHATLYLATGDRAEADFARDELLSYMATLLALLSCDDASTAIHPPFETSLRILVRFHLPSAQATPCAAVALTPCLRKSW
ncbi:MAG: hypothetical protein Fur0032_11550 [Terrimicrobiaceae bacterium]